MKYLAIIECTDAGGFEIGMAAIHMGFQPLFLLNPDSYKADLAISLQHFEFINVDTQSLEKIISVLEPIRDQIAGIATLVDSRLAIAAQVAQQLSLPGPDQACILLKDKAIVVKLCPEYSLATVSLSEKIVNDQSKLKAILNNKKVVAKKRSGCGAVGIKFLCSSVDKLKFINETFDLDDWIFQDYFDGDLFSMEGWVENSSINFIGWTSRRKIFNTETEFRFEGFHTIPEALTQYACDAIKKLFIQSDFKKGWFHIEFIVNTEKSRAVMIDANVGRIGGAMLPHVLAMALAKSPVQVYQHVLETQVFGSSSVEISCDENHEKIYKCICFGSPDAILIDHVQLPEYPLKTNGLRVVRILGEGDYVTKIGRDDWSWVGFVSGSEDEVDDYTSKIRIKSHDGIVHAAAF